MLDNLAPQVGRGHGSSGTRNLLLAVGWEQQFLSLEDSVGVLNLRISCGNAAPVGGSAVLRLRNFRKRVAPLHCDLHIRGESQSVFGHDELRPHSYAVGIGDGRISCHQFVPARAAAQVLHR